MTDAVEEKPLTKRQKAKAETKDRVLAACRALFAEEGGYAAATIRSIAKAAGMSTGAFFNSFDSKEAAYREIYGHDPITPEQGRALLKALCERVYVGAPLAGPITVSFGDQTLTLDPDKL